MYAIEQLLKFTHNINNVHVSLESNTRFALLAMFAICAVSSNGIWFAFPFINIWTRRFHNN